MAKYSDALYADAIAATIGDIYYSSGTSYKSRIASMRSLTEYYIRRLIKHNPDWQIELGDDRTIKALNDAGINEKFFKDAYKVIRKNGNTSSHSPHESPTKEEFDNVAKAVVTIQAYLFFDFFKKYGFGTNKAIMSEFSLLPPFFRLTVLRELVYLEPRNVEILHKFSLALLKTIGKESSLEYIEQEKDKLEKFQLDGTALFNAQLIGLESGTDYDYIRQEIVVFGDRFDNMPVMYKSFDDAKKYFVGMSNLAGDTEDVIEFKALMKYIYLGR